MSGPAVTPHVTTAGDIYEMAIYIQESQYLTYIVNVFHFRAINSGLTANSLIVDWRANVETAHRACLHTGAQIVRYNAFNLIPFTTDTAEARPLTFGTAGSQHLPPIVSAVCTWRTSTPGRRYRGRSYIGPLTYADILSGRLQSAAITARFNPFANAILNRYGATGSSTDTRIGVWSRVNGNQSPPHSPAGFTQITSHTIQQNLGSMGTRRIGRGI